MADGAVPVEIAPRGGAEFFPPGDVAEPLGVGVAGMLRYLAAVLDREDRLEAGTGQWKASFAADAADRRATVRESVLRALRIAVEPACYRILEELSAGARSGPALAEATGLGRLALAERVSDLVSAGLAAKVPEADQVAGTPAGAAVVRLVQGAVDAGDRELGTR